MPTAHWVAALALAGCATPYQKMGFEGGVSERRIAPGVYYVEARGNGYTSAATIAYYVELRAYQLCRDEGFPRYRLLDPNAETSTQETSPTYTTDYRATYSGVEATTRRNPGIAFRKHAASAKAVCMTREEWDAWQSAARENLLQRQ